MQLFCWKSRPELPHASPPPHTKTGLPRSTVVSAFLPLYVSRFSQQYFCYKTQNHLRFIRILPRCFWKRREVEFEQTVF